MFGDEVVHAGSASGPQAGAVVSVGFWSSGMMFAASAGGEVRVWTAGGAPRVWAAGPLSGAAIAGEHGLVTGGKTMRLWSLEGTLQAEAR